MVSQSFFDRVLVPVDGSLQSLISEEIAVIFAKNFDSKITVLHVLSHEFFGPPTQGLYESEYVV